MFRLQPSHHQAKVEHSLGTQKVCTLECTLSLYLDYVLLWPNDGQVAVETCCLDVNYRVLYNYWYYMLCFQTVIKIPLSTIVQGDGSLASKKKSKLYAPVFYPRTNSHWYSGRPQWQYRIFKLFTNISQRNSIYGGFKFLFVFVVCVQKK